MAHDNIIDVNTDRVVISQTNGIDIRDYLKAHHGELFAYGQTMSDIIGDGKTYSSFINMMDTLAAKSGDTEKKIVIYVDNNQLTEFLVTWYKTIFANPDKDATKDLIDSKIFRYKVFNRGRFVRVSHNGTLTTEMEISNYDNVWAGISAPSSSDRTTFINNHKSGFNIELMLANYYNNGGLKDELKSTIKTLMKKDLEKYLLELKEIFFVHFLNSNFAGKLSLSKTYNFENMADILDDTSTFPDLFLNDRIWKYKYMNHATTGDNVHFTNITAQDITNFKDFTTKSGECWSEENVYTQIKSDVNKLDFLDIYTDFTDARLTDLLNAESTFENAAGSFFSIDLETVNHYFVQTILERKTDTTFLSKYSIV